MRNDFYAFREYLIKQQSQSLLNGNENFLKSYINFHSKKKRSIVADVQEFLQIRSNKHSTAEHRKVVTMMAHYLEYKSVHPNPLAQHLDNKTQVVDSTRQASAKKANSVINRIKEKAENQKKNTPTSIQVKATPLPTKRPAPIEPSTKRKRKTTEPQFIDYKALFLECYNGISALEVDAKLSSGAYKQSQVSELQVFLFKSLLRSIEAKDTSLCAKLVKEINQWS